MDYSMLYNHQQPFGGLVFPPTPHTDFEGDSPSQTYGGYDQYSAFDGFGSAAAVPVTVKAPGTGLDMEESIRARSSSEEKESLTPAQSRRKAQNRQAQRAFRERKEKAFKDLEAKLASMQASSSTVMSENEQLRQELSKMKTENEILRATSNLNSNSNNGVNGAPGVGNAGVSVGPMKYNPTDFYDNLLAKHANKTPSHRIVVSQTTGERLLGPGATWDLIVSHTLYKEGLVDVGEVCDKLKGMARCDGQGPVFEECVINQAIVESAASGRDELI